MLSDGCRRALGLVLGALILLFVSSAWANGAYTHIHMSQIAVKDLPDGPLKDLMSDPTIVPWYEAGSMFPDSGYAASDGYGELAHWPPFQNAYIQYIIDTYGSIRPFTNIIRAEETHIETLLPLFETYGITAPADDAASRIAKVASLTEAYEAGVEAEIDNIAMYEAFLSEDLPSDVRVVFESLMSASESHLKAFENKL